MSASQVMLTAFALLIVAHWANNQPAIDGRTLVLMVFAILFIAMLDHGKTEPVAQGFAWLFLVAVLLSKNSPLAILKNFSAKTAKQTTTGKPVLA